MKETVIRISPSGDLTMLYSDDSPMLAHAGSIEVTRVSDVHFDNKTQQWVVDGVGDAESRRALSGVGTFNRRRDALDAEVHALNAMLKGGR